MSDETCQGCGRPANPLHLPSRFQPGDEVVFDGIRGTITAVTFDHDFPIEWADGTERGAKILYTFKDSRGVKRTLPSADSDRLCPVRSVT